MDSDKKGVKRARTEGGNERQLQQDPVHQVQSKPEQDHVFSGLTNRNLDHILSKIVSYLPGKDVRSCLWTCRALRHAALSNREAMDRETELRFELKPRKVSDKFETGFEKWEKRLHGDKPNKYVEKFGFEKALTVEARGLRDKEAGSLMDKMNLKMLSLSEDFESLVPKFGTDWKDRICRIVGIRNSHLHAPILMDPSHLFTPMGVGDLVMVETLGEGWGFDGSKRITKCYIVRLDDKEESGGKIIDQWNGVDILDEEDRNDYCLLNRPYGYLYDSDLQGMSCRRENLVFYVYSKKCDYYFNCPSEGPNEFIFALMVDLEKNKVLWKKDVWSLQGWRDHVDIENVFITDKICGFFQGVKLKSMRPRRFDLETGAEMSPWKLDEPEKCWISTMKVVSGNKVVAFLTSNNEYKPDYESFNLLCHMFDVQTTLVRRHCLAIPEDEIPEDLDSHGVGFSMAYVKDNADWFHLFGDSVLAMCDNHVRSENCVDRTARVCFAFWNLDEPIRKVKVGVPLERESLRVYIEEEADLIMAKLVWLDGFINIGPSLTGNVWFLLSSEVESRCGRKRIWHNVHAVNLNRSVGALWKISRNQE